MAGTRSISKRRAVASQVFRVICGLLVFLSAGFPAGFAIAGSRSLKPQAFHARRFLVLPRADAAEHLKGFQKAAGQRVLRTFPRLGGLQVVGLPEWADVRESVASCRDSGFVRFAEPDYFVTSAALPDDPRFQDGTQWWLNNYGQSGGLPDADIDAPEGWDLRTSASGVIVAIIDSGLRQTHEDLSANLWVNPADGTHGFNALTGGHDPLDDNGHGTHIAGIIGALGNNTRGVAGVAWQTQLMACKFLDSNGTGYASEAIQCIEFARSNRAQVLNLSWGGSDFSESMYKALWFARTDGILVVTAAGNTAADLNLLPYYPACLELDNLLTVGASTRHDAVWSLSSYSQNHVHLFAPGAQIYSTSAAGDSSYETRNGTSMASACVAGALALLRAADPSASTQALRERLFAAVDRVPAYTGKCATGGRLNLRKALDRPEISIGKRDGGLIEVYITGVLGHLYVLYNSTNLQSWSPIATNRIFAAPWVYKQASLGSKMYFRAVPAE